MDDQLIKLLETLWNMIEMDYTNFALKSEAIKQRQIVNDIIRLKENDGKDFLGKKAFDGK